VKAFVRPDGRCFVSEPVVDPGRDLYATVDEADEERRRAYEELGFVVNRRHSHYVIPTRVADAEVPAGFVFVRADEVSEERLRLLDDALRQDVPGTDGWQWDEEGFRNEFDSSFDPATYLIAVDQAGGEHVGIARVWNKPAGPRLGFIGVLPEYRRRGLARALLVRVFAVLHERGQSEVSTGVDDTNVASTSLIASLGGRRVGGSIELIRRAR
jgi:ribosomal protein S18 acetylase RimI-like enzyme